MDESAAGSLIGIIMSPLVLLIVYATVKGAATGPVERNGMAGPTPGSWTRGVITQQVAA